MHRLGERSVGARGAHLERVRLAAHDVARIEGVADQAGRVGDLVERQRLDGGVTDGVGDRPLDGDPRDAALAGGVTIELPQGRGYIYKPNEILSPDGHCRAFDHRSQGTVFGSGAAVVLLRRLSDAIADGDHIWAVVRGSAINNDGAAKAQLRALQEKWDDAGKVPRKDMDRLEKGMRRIENAVRDAEQAQWKKSDPEVSARANSMVTQLENAVASLRSDVEAAEAAGNSTAGTAMGALLALGLPTSATAAILLAAVLLLYWLYDRLIGIDNMKLG